MAKARTENQIGNVSGVAAEALRNLINENQELHEVISMFGDALTATGHGGSVHALQSKCELCVALRPSFEKYLRLKYLRLKA